MEIDGKKKHIYIQCKYIVFTLQCQKVLKKLPNCMVIAETSVVLIIFKGVFCEISTYTVTGSLYPLHESGIRKALLGP